MATAPYDGGIGGKFKKRPFRRAPATPYDRPPAAARRPRGNTVEAGGNGWLSKIVDPASKIIYRSASRLFSSVFRKRLAAPPAVPEENPHSRQEVPEVLCTEQSSELQGQGGNARENLPNNYDTDGTHQETLSGTDEIFEVEQLLKQKTFTRVEFDRLTDLLHSRTIEPSKLRPSVNYEKKEKANISEQVQHNKQSNIEPSTSQPPTSYEKTKKANVFEEDGIGSFRLHGNITNPAVNLMILEKEAASPAEIAKAYMGSRPSKLSPFSLSLRGQIFREDTALPSNVPYAKKPPNVLITPRSAVHFSGIPELSENGYMTPRPRGRSTIYKMSRSPYFKAHPTTNVRGGRPSRDGYAGLSTSSPWITPNVMHSGGKLVPKRGSSVLDSDLGSCGPIRRIRRKSNLISPLTEKHSSTPGNQLSTPTAPLGHDVNQWSTSSIQKPLHLDELKYGTTELQDVENGDNRIPSASVAPIPPQSSEMARKILQQLDKLVPSPKEKSFEMKVFDRDGSPSKLVLNVSHVGAQRSMKDIDSTKFLNVQGSGTFDAATGSHLPHLRSFVSQKQDMVEENGPSKPAVSGVKVTSEALGMDNSVMSATGTKPSMTYFAISGSAAVPSQQKPAFHLNGPEDSPGLDGDKYNIGSAFGSPTTGNDTLKLMVPEQKTFFSETTLLEKPLASSSRSMSASTSILNGEVDMKASDRPVTEKDVSFAFRVAPSFVTCSQPPSMPVIPSPSVDRSAPQKEEIAAPAFEFGSKGSSTMAAVCDPTASTMDAVCDPTGMKYGASAATTSALPAGSNLDKGGKTQQAGDLFKSLGNAASSGLSPSTSPFLFAFGTSTSPSLSNGSLAPTSSTFTVSAASVVTFSDSSLSSALSTSGGTITSSSSTSISSAEPMLSTIPSFHFGSGTSTGAPISFSSSNDKSDSRDLEKKPLKAPPSGISSSIAPGTLAAFSNTGSTCSAPETSSVFSAMDRSSFAPATSSLFSSTSIGSSPQSTSSAFSTTRNGIFGFTASAQSSSSSSLPFGNNSSQNSTTFGAPAGSIFGTQATQAESGLSNFSPSSANQFGSFASPPMFGLNASCSLASGSSPFGSATLGAKPFGSSIGFSFSTGAVSSISDSGSSFAPTAPISFFSSSSHPSSSSIFGSPFGSSTSSPSSGVTLGLSAPTSGSSALTFGASSGPVFSFTSAVTTTSSASPSLAHPVFGIPTPAAGFSSESSGNDQMKVEDSMADDAIQAAVPLIPTFGQPASSPSTPNFMFSAPDVPLGPPLTFQFGSHQNSSVPQNPSPFQVAGNLELSAGGSFSLGSGGGDKSGRKFIKIKRDKLRKK